MYLFQFLVHTSKHSVPPDRLCILLGLYLTDTATHTVLVNALACQRQKHVRCKCCTGPVASVFVCTSCLLVLRNYSKWFSNNPLLIKNVVAIVCFFLPFLHFVGCLFFLVTKNSAYAL